MKHYYTMFSLNQQDSMEWERRLRVFFLLFLEIWRSAQ